MMSSTVCTDFEAAGTIDRYVAGRSSAAETADFELHLIGCETCQEAVRVGAATRAVTRDDPPALGSPSRRLFTGQRMLALAAGLAAITIGVNWFGQRAALRSLGAVPTAPPYQGMQVRSSVSAADSLFANGMALYAAGKFADARASLEGALGAGADSVPVSFFIAVTHLVAGDGAEAIPWLRATLRGGDTPYAAEARYLVGKAFLQLGRADSAMTHLRAVGEGSAVGAMARALADSVAEIRR